MDIQWLERVERNNYLIGTGMFVVTFMMAPREFAYGVGVGALLTAANFSVMRRLAAALLSGQGKKQSTAALVLVPKMFVLLGLITLCVYFLPISPLGLALGFSVFLLSIAVEVVRTIVHPEQSSE